MNSERDPYFGSVTANERMIVLVPSEVASTPEGDALNLVKIWSVVWEGKWLIVAITAVVAICSLTYALLATPWYRAETVIIPATPDQNLLKGSGLAGLASLAGVTVGEDRHSAEAIAVLRSREFVRSFIETEKLLPVLFADEWDAARGTWKSNDSEQRRDVRDGIKLFESRILQVNENKKSGLITVSVEWTDREAAARWANLLVVRVNDRMRARTEMESEKNVKFLRAELAGTTVVTLQQSVSRLLEVELEKLMLARSNEEYAFRVVDRAEVPKWRSRPKRTMTVALGTMGGGIIALLVVFLRHAWRQDRASVADQVSRAAGA